MPDIVRGAAGGWTVKVKSTRTVTDILRRNTLATSHTPYHPRIIPVGIEGIVDSFRYPSKVYDCEGGCPAPVRDSRRWVWNASTEGLRESLRWLPLTIDRLKLEKRGSLIR